MKTSGVGESALRTLVKYGPQGVGIRQMEKCASP